MTRNGWIGTAIIAVVVVALIFLGLKCGGCEWGDDSKAGMVELKTQLGKANTRVDSLAKAQADTVRKLRTEIQSLKAKIASLPNETDMRRAITQAHQHQTPATRTRASRSRTPRPTASANCCGSFYSGGGVNRQRSDQDAMEAVRQYEALHR